MSAPAGDAWSDHTTHDPGVTTLEALSYALVDLATDFGRRVRAGQCGWRCTVAVVAGAAAAAGAVVLVRRRPRRIERTSRAVRRGLA